MSRLLLACAAWAMAAALGAAPVPGPLPRDSVYQLPVRLADQDAREFDWGIRRGKPQVVSLFYTSCKYVCPLIVDSGKAVQKQLLPADRARIDILLISMDPARDTPAALKAVARTRKLESPNWTLARPVQSQVRAIAGLLSIRYRALADGEFNHTSALVLLDSEGRILARTERIGGVADPEFVAAVRLAAKPARAPTALPVGRAP